MDTMDDAMVQEHFAANRTRLARFEPYLWVVECAWLCLELRVLDGTRARMGWTAGLVAAALWWFVWHRQLLPPLHVSRRALSAVGRTVALAALCHWLAGDSGLPRSSVWVPAVVWGPLLEELGFRVLVVSLLLRRLPRQTPQAIALRAGAAFGLYHVINGGQVWVLALQCAMATASGASSALHVISQGSLWESFALHATSNALALAFHARHVRIGSALMWLYVAGRLGNAWLWWRDSEQLLRVQGGSG